MSKIITKRIIPILLLVMLCIGMFPTAFAEAEITIADTSASTQIEVVQDSSGADITVVPNEDAGDLITDEEPDSAPVDESSSSGAESSSGSSHTIEFRSVSLQQRCFWQRDLFQQRDRHHSRFLQYKQYASSLGRRK